MTFWTICPILSFEVIRMTDYQKLYLTMFRASEKAIELLIEAQRKCEEEVLRSGEDENSETETI